MARKRYANLDNVPNTNSFKALREWRKERRGKVKDLTYVVPQAPNKELAFLQTNRQAKTITWIGHSSFLIQFGGLNILTDPVWSKTMGFDRRLSDPGLAIEQLPPIDIVLISHGHYDHLDLPTLRQLKRRGPFRVLAPAGLGDWFKRKGFADCIEKEWWGLETIAGVNFHFVPAQHWTRRSLLDTNTSHWGGWVIAPAGVEQGGAGADGRESECMGDQTGGTSEAIYYAGDSGYFRGFGLIGERFRIQAALMPIGAYEPEWFMRVQHVSPEEAVQAFLDTRAELFVPMHYGAFRLADDTPKEALDRLDQAWGAHGLPAERLQKLLLGETLRL